MLNFTTGLSAIRASQIGLDTVAHNIANANTPGYHRQDVRFVDRPPHEQYDLLIGTGVDASHIQRLRHDITENAITDNIAASADAEAQLHVLRRIESHLSPRDGSFQDRLQSFMDSFSQLSRNISDATSRRTVIDHGAALTDSINEFSSSLQHLKSDLDAQIVETVDEINDHTKAVAEINRQIRLAEARGLTPNDLLDRRDQMVNELAEMVDARAVEQSEGQSIVLLAQDSVLVGVQPAKLSVRIDEDGQVVIRHEGLDDPISPGGGRLSGLLSARNEIVAGYEGLLRAFTSGLITGVDGTHATGIGSSGSFDVLHGIRTVNDVSAPLAESVEGLPLSFGDLAVAVTDLTTGRRTLSSIAIDPSTQSLQDVAAAVSAIDDVQATVGAQTGALTIIAAPGYQFDFAGGLETEIDTSGIGGSAAPSIHGFYSGESNDSFQFQMIGSGTVGVTPGLTLEVRDAAGAFIASLDIGEQYEPDSRLEIGNGTSVSLAPGTVIDGDNFSVAAVAQSDTSGILIALGLNSFFAGSTPGSIGVNPFVSENHGRLATGKGGAVGTAANLPSLIALRDEALLAGSTVTLERFVGDMIAGIGFDVQDLDAVSENLSFLNRNLEAERASVSGVNPNEELVHMLQFQRSFQAAARIVSTVDEVLADLMQVIR
jgi:flagellar hook-associated protein FlgK